MNQDIKFILKWIGITIGGLVVVFLIMAVFILPMLREEGLSENDPCGAKSPQGLCYSIPQALCLSVWDFYHKECEQAIKEELRKDKPSSLIGPAVKSCVIKKFDKVMYYNRTNQEDPVCSGYFQNIQN